MMSIANTVGRWLKYLIKRIYELPQQGGKGHISANRLQLNKICFRWPYWEGNTLKLKK